MTYFEQLEHKYGQELAWRALELQFSHHDEWQQAWHAMLFFQGEVRSAIRDYRDWLTKLGVQRSIGQKYATEQDIMHRDRVRAFYKLYRTAQKEFHTLTTARTQQLHPLQKTG